ncbi:hypothetical protein HYPSUDRAFT_201349 [Hypholoma sublateritium FD-334 SS-4]|uniref:NAD(P)-binding protein n=1 Tax=Hypholoma sublateritium (strain FD-334 SS-4) TaxID=945553 RepID=A0A0D2PVW0_HYPSF|nr:hypothetical protein HYPSUDRAFT_201349 [Hypholoma sublateritium FD-334 SS-4]
MQFKVAQFLKEQYNPVSAVVQADLQGKTVIVTGANNGIGFETAKHFARMNPAKLILACRSQERGEAAVKKIWEETGCSNVELWLLDLASFESVKAFAERFEREGTRLDLLVENAAILPEEKFVPTSDGWEPVFQVNNLSTALLALLLLPKMLATAEEFSITPRLVIVSSEVHFWTKIEDVVLESDNPLKMFGSSAEYIPSVLKTRYEDSKLLNVFFTRALNEKLVKKPVIVNCVNPGYCYSGLRKSWTGPRAWADWLMEKALARTAEEGSRQVVWAAVGEVDALDKLRGAYISLAKVSEPSDYVLSEEGGKAQDKLWDNLVDELVKIDPKVSSVVEDHSLRPL